MLKTNFYFVEQGQTHLLGSLSWNGQGIVIEPPDSEELKEISEGVVGVGPQIYTKETPEMFVRALHTKYRSPYFFATEAQEDQEPPTVPAEPEQPTLFAEPLTKTQAPVISDRPKKKVVEEEFDRDPHTGLITRRRITTIEEE